MGSFTARHPAPVGTLGVLGNARHLLLEAETTGRGWRGWAFRFAVRGDAALLRVAADSPVLDAIRRRPIVKVGACTRRGKPLNGYVNCMARVIPVEQEAQADAAFRRSRLRRAPLKRLAREQGVYVELAPMTLAGPVPDDEAVAIATAVIRDDAPEPSRWQPRCRE